MDSFDEQDLPTLSWADARNSDVTDTLTQSLDAEVTRKTTALLKGVQDAK